MEILLKSNLFNEVVAVHEIHLEEETSAQNFLKNKLHNKTWGNVDPAEDLLMNKL